ncbi:putative Filamin/ABP280 repeat protein, partial [Trichinella nativa]
ATPVVVSRGIAEDNSAETEFSEKSWTFALPGTGRLTAKVVMPSKKTDTPIIRDNADGSVSVKYQPSEVGLHELQIKHDGLHVPGSPFSFHVGQVDDGYVTAYGNGLSFGIAGEPAQFTVCAREPRGGRKQTILITIIYYFLH